MMDGVQHKIKESGLSLGLLVLKSLTGLFVGLTFALIFREAMNIGNFLFTFIIVAFGIGFLKVSQTWGFLGYFLFNLFCILVGMLLRMYILIAPGQ